MYGKWTQEMIDMLYSEESNIDIAKKLKKTPGAVKNARYHYTGHCGPLVVKPIGREFISEEEGIRRIIALCDKLGVKLLGGTQNG